jgi:hypothetical protein
VDYQNILNTVHATVTPLIGCGRLPEGMPALATVDPSRFGLALATVDAWSVEERPARDLRTPSPEPSSAPECTEDGMPDIPDG